MENPFRPGFGQYPLVAARRTELLQRWSDAFHPATPSHPANKTVLIGDRGIGKTVLLDTAIDIAYEQGWVIADAAGVDTPSLSQRLIGRLWRPEPPRHQSTKLAVKLGPGAWERVWQPPIDTPPVSLREAVEIVLSSDRDVTPTGVLLVVDELHDVPAAQVKQVANDLQLLERDGYRVGFVGAGLANLDLGDEGQAPTFLARAWRPELGAVDDDEISRVFLATLDIVGRDASAAATRRVIRAVGGLPYALQLLGWHLVDHTDGRIVPAHVEAVLPTVHHTLVNALRLDYSLSPGRAAVLAAMADHHGPVELATVCRRLQKSPQQLAPVRAWLLDNGYLTAPARGQLDFAHLGLRALIASDPELANQIASWADPPRRIQAQARGADRRICPDGHS